MHAGDVIDGRFEVERLIGAGGMGKVYRAIDRTTGETVAVKVLVGTNLQEGRRFAREAQALASMRLPGVVRYIAHGVTDTGQRYLAMEWLAGETLSERLERGPLTVAESLALGARVATTLGAIHRLGVVHRDIKPSNLQLVSGDPAGVTLLDFGIARLTNLETQLTAAGAILGTPGYMAPEQVRAEPRIDARADVFALGCVLYRCLTGRAAFHGVSGLAVLAKVILDEPPPVRSLRAEVSPALDDLVRRMLAKSPAARPADGAMVAAELADVAAAVADASPRAGARAELSTGERKVMCLVIARDVPATAASAPHRRAALAALAERHEQQGRGPGAEGAEPRPGAPEIDLELALPRVPLLVLSGSVTPTDLAAQAARCALELQVLLDDAPVVLVTGRAEVAETLPVGRLIDRAVMMLPETYAPSPTPAVRIDDVTVGLIGGRFACSEGEGGCFLHREVDPLAAAPRLLGRAIPFIGRERELAALLGELTGCLEEPAATFVLATGPAGMGKSRLRHEFLSRVKDLGERVAVWAGQADSMTAGSAFGLLSSALRRELDIADGEPIAARRAKVRARVARHQGLDAARVAAFLGELVGAPFPDEADVQLRSARRNPMLMSDQLRLAFEDLLRCECEAQPVLLVLEDLHWGDLPTVKLIDAALRNLPELPFMVLALGRPEVHEIFPKLWEGRRGQELRITPMPRRASERLARRALGDAARDDLVAKIVERAGGNPFYIEELIRASTVSQEAELPETVLAMVHARLDGLPLGARRALRAASVFGQHFSQRGVAALLGGEGAAQPLLELERHEIITPQRGGEREGDIEYRFRHALVREAAYGMLTDRDLRIGHALAGAFLEQSGDADPMALAEHFERGAEPARAAAAYLRAAEQALRGSDLGKAIERADRGLSCGPAPELAGALRLVQAEAHIWRGDLALAEARGIEAAERLARGSAPWFLAIARIVNAVGKLGTLERAERWMADARDAAVAEGAMGARNICLAECCCQLVSRGDYAAADTIERALPAPDTIDPGVAAWIHQTRAFRTSSTGNAEASLRNFEAALTAFEQTGDRRNSCITRGNVAVFRLELGDHAGAEALLRAALAAAEQMELHEVATVLRGNLGHALAYTGKLDEADAIERAAIEAAERIGLPRIGGNARTYRARIALFAGRFEEAEREARLASDVLRIAQPLRAAAVALLAQALLGLGRTDEALEAAREAFGLIETLGAVEEGESTIRLTYAEALAVAGREADAAAAIASAEQALMARAAGFQDTRWRASFLEKVPEHARTRELARRWASSREER